MSHSAKSAILVAIVSAACAGNPPGEGESSPTTIDDAMGDSSTGDAEGEAGSEGPTDSGETGPPIECVPGDRRCSSNGEGIEVCDDAGQWSSSSCGPDMACTESTGEPTCYSTLDCADEQVVCWDDESYLSCTQSGEWGAPSLCPPGTVCDWGASSPGSICKDQVFGLDYALYLDEATGVDCNADVGSPSDVYVDVFAWRGTDSDWVFAGSFPTDSCPLAWSSPIIVPNIDDQTAVLLRFWDDDVSEDDFLGEACKGADVGVCYWLAEEDLSGQTLVWQSDARAEVRLERQ